MLAVSCRTDADWLSSAVGALATDGYAVVTEVLDAAFLAETREAMYRVQDAIHADVGAERLDRAGEQGVLRCMMRYDPHFFRFLAIPEVLAVLDATISSTAVLHTQNGFVLRPTPGAVAPDIFQHRFHPDFPRVLNGYLMSVNTLFPISPFSEDNGGTLLLPGTQQRTTPLDDAALAQAVAVDCPAGSMIVFDSTLMHAAGINRTAEDRLGVNHQFTRSYLKQQLDYVRALGEDRIAGLPPRTQQILGWYTRVPTSLDEYYRPADARLYRAGQG